MTIPPPEKDPTKNIHWLAVSPKDKEELLTRAREMYENTNSSDEDFYRKALEIVGINADVVSGGTIGPALKIVAGLSSSKAPGEPLFPGAMEMHEKLDAIVNAACTIAIDELKKRGGGVFLE